LNFSEILVRLQAERQESNYRLAKLLGVHQSTIKNWKSGAKPQPKNMELLSEHYGISVEELMGGRK